MKNWILSTLLLFLVITVSAQINKLDLDITGVSPVCHSFNGAATGEINVTVLGGTPGYSYSCEWLCLRPNSNFKANWWEDN